MESSKSKDMTTDLPSKKIVDRYRAYFNDKSHAYLIPGTDSVLTKHEKEDARVLKFMLYEGEIKIENMGGHDVYVKKTAAIQILTEKLRTYLNAITNRN